MSSDFDLNVPPSGPGCRECEQTGGWWLHLRRCAACGHVGCCDSSLGKHATAHWRETGHRVIQSFEPGEQWFWDFEDEGMFEGPELEAPRSHPAGQGVPGPKGRVPDNWRELLEAATAAGG